MAEINQLCRVSTLGASDLLVGYSQQSANSAGVPMSVLQTYMQDNLNFNTTPTTNDAVVLQGQWNASTNVPALASGTGTEGFAYIVNTAGTTALDGITSWDVGDWAVFDGTVWRKLSGGYSTGNFGALYITDFLNRTTPTQDQTAAVQAALTALGQAGPGATLDLCGLLIYVNSTLTYDDTAVSSGVFYKPKTIQNGTLVTPATWTSGVAAPILKITNSAGTTLADIKVVNVNLQCNNFSSGILVDGAYNYIQFYNCEIQQPYTFGISDNNANSVGMVISGCRIWRWDSGTAFNVRTCTGIKLIGGDSKILGCSIEYMNIGVDISNSPGGLLMNGTHIYQGNTSGSGNLTGYGYAMALGPQPNAYIANCYIDDGVLCINANGVAMGSLGRLSIYNTYFIVANATSAYSYVVARAGAANTKFFDIVIRGCMFNAVNGHSTAYVVSTPFGLDTSPGGTFATNTSSDIYITENFWINTTQQDSHYKVGFALVSGTTTYAYDRTGLTPFGLGIVGVDCLGWTTTASFSGTSVPAMYGQNSGTYTGNIVLSAAPGAGGLANVVFNVNNTLGTP